VVYEIIRVEGEGELARSFGALWWSAFAAGLSIGFSVLTQGMLKAYLPNTPGAAIVENLGYSVGFLIVILSRQQLFTENTLTAVLPVIARKEWKWLPAMLRLWGIVLATNLVRCFLVRGLARLFGSALAGDRRGHQGGWPQMFVKGIVSGGLIAALVWMLPSAEGTEIFRHHAEHLSHRPWRIHPCRGGLGGGVLSVAGGSGELDPGRVRLLAADARRQSVRRHAVIRRAELRAGARRDRRGLNR
jgi:hypothetical protein